VVAAVAAGGVVTFDCGPDPVTIVLQQTATIFNNTGPEIVIDRSVISDNLGGTWYPTYPQISGHSDTPITVTTSIIRWEADFLPAAASRPGARPTHRSERPAHPPKVCRPCLCARKVEPGDHSRPVRGVRFRAR
jgi:hypothetical protein